MDGISGKYGRMHSNIGGSYVRHEFNNWSINESADPVPMDGYDKTANALGQFRKNVAIGLIGGTATIKGRWSRSKAPYSYFYAGREFLDPDNDQTGNYLFLGNDEDIGFYVWGKILSVKPTNELTGGADFEFEFFIEGITFLNA